jgi:dihydroneopterin aldolase
MKSSSIYTIHLENLSFFGFHGLYPEEKKIGQWFELNLEIQFTSSGTVHRMDETIDYTKVYAYLKERMKISTPLLETLAHQMMDDIFEMNSNIIHIKISIFKQQPPIAQFQGRLGVSCEKNYSNE